MNPTVVWLARCLCLFMIISEKLISAASTFDIVPKLYEEIGCTQVTAGEKPGFMSFNCPNLKKYEKTKCYLNGKKYNIGDIVQSDDMPSCRAACTCTRTADERDRKKAAHIDCAHVECPDSNRNCVQQYDHSKACCRSREICFQNKIEDLGICVLEGKNYRVGERMFPKDSCYECLCTADYDSNITYADNRGCSKMKCGIELDMKDLRAGCVPIYYLMPNCCPIDYKCPMKNDSIKSSARAGEKKTCKFGKLTLKRGDYLKSRAKDCVKCKCAYPPYLTCIKLKCDN